MLAGVVVSIAPDPFAVARGLVARGHRHVALLQAAGSPGAPHGRFSFVAADPDDHSEALDPHDVAASLASGAASSGELGRAPRWIGVIPYDARRELERPGWRPADTRPPALLAKPLWYRYPAVACFDHRTGMVRITGVDGPSARAFAAAVRGLPTESASLELDLAVDDDEPPLRHAERVGAARELILAGDLYQVNLARRLRVTLRAGSPLALYARLAAAARAPFSAHLTLGDDITVLSTSPELLLSAEPSRDGATFGALATEPIKGTRPRGAHAREDLEHVLALDADPKERAELSMIVDVERNDLGRVAEIGSVRITEAPHVVTHRTIHHRVAHLTARARASVSREEVVRAMVPSGSVTGAPKIRAMEVIATLESRRRGLYTGALGFVRHDGGMELAMAIRTVVLRGAEGEYWTGGGIVADSDPLRELEETRWKALQLMRAVGAR